MHCKGITIPFAALAVLCIATLLFDRFGTHTNLITNIVQAIVPYVTGFLCIRTGRLLGPIVIQKSKAWITLGFGILIWATGQAIWTVNENFLKVEPFPSISDIGFVLFYPFCLLSIFQFTTAVDQRRRIRNALDAGIMATGFGVLCWYYIIRALLVSNNSIIEKSLLIAYPTLDIVAIFGAIWLLMSSTGAGKRVWGLLGAGIMMLAVADTGFAFTELNNLKGAMTGMDGMWLFSFGLMGIAAQEGFRNAESFLPSREKGASNSISQQSALAVAFPYVLALLATTAVVCSELVTKQHLNISTVVACTIVVLLLFIRQFITLFENQILTLKVHAESEQNRDLADELQSLNDNLEQIVDVRTRQINALNKLTKSVSSSLDVDNVLEAACGTILEAFEAEGIAVWLHSGPEQQLRIRYTAGAQPVIMVLSGLYRRENEEVECGEYFSLAKSPIVWRQQIMGYIALGSTQRRFADGDHELLDSIAMEIATALRHALLYADAVRKADHDSITELYNHRALQQRLDQLLEACSSTNQPAYVMLIDLDNFKFFNDTYGHLAGDAVLRKVAEAIRLESSKQDAGGRHGGDEFMMVGYGQSIHEVRALANRLRERLQNEGHRVDGDERVVPIGASFGIAMFPNDGRTRQELLAVADANLYSAKKTPDNIATSSDSQRVNIEIRTLDDFRGLDGMITSVDNKDRYTRRHSEDVCEYALWIAREIGMSEDEMHALRITALLHDVGKIAVPDHILRKPGRLTDEEYEILKSHAHFGAMIVSAMPGMSQHVDGIRSHHERYDGHGYPDGLVGEAIPSHGRILAVADAFSAMTTDRPYRKGMEWPVALEIIEKNKGTQFDPAYATAFLKVAWSKTGYQQAA